jgi:hypothetical protein
VFVMYFHSGMRLSQVFHILFFHMIKQSPSTDVFMQIQFCADTNFTKFLSSCDDCQAFKRKFYLNQFICISPVHTQFFPPPFLSIHREWQLLLHVNCLKLFMEMKLYLAQDFNGWSGGKMVNEVQKKCACKIKGSKQ